MSSTVWESFHLRAPLERVWELVKPCTFAYLPTVESAEPEAKGPLTEVGGHRSVRYKDGTVQKIRITHLSEVDYSVGWELEESAPTPAFSGQSHSVRLRRVTEGNTTFIEWTTVFSSDASQEVIQDARYKQAENFTAIASTLGVPVSQPKLTLTYFPIRGRAECSRLMMAQAGLVYDDCRLTREQWGKMKATTPWGQLPTLTIDGKTFAQSNSIERYIARLGGLGGANAWEFAQVDAITQSVKDAAPAFVSAVSPFENKTEEEKVPKLEAYFKGDFIKWATQFNKALLANNEGKGWFVGNKVSYADISLFNLYSGVQKANPDAFRDFPALAGWLGRVAALPRIAAWLKARPVTPF